MSHGMDKFNPNRFSNKRLLNKPTFDWGIDTVKIENIRYREPQSKRPQIIRPRVYVDVVDMLEMLKKIDYNSYLSHLKDYREMTPEEMRYINYGGQLYNVAKATFIETIFLIDKKIREEIEKGKYDSSIKEREEREIKDEES